MQQAIVRVAQVAAALLAAMGPLAARDAEGQEEVLALYRRAEALRKAGKLPEALTLYERARSPGRGGHPRSSVSLLLMSATRTGAFHYPPAG
jgi:hypothetical protein